jgi:hypothetical protein
MAFTSFTIVFTVVVCISGSLIGLITKQRITRYGSVTEEESNHFGIRGIVNVEYKRRVCIGTRRDRARK